MKFKLLLLVAILAVAMVGIYTPEAKAQGPGVTPYAGALLWFGYTSKSKEASWKVDDTGAAEDDADVYMAVTPQASVGVRGTANNVMVDFSIMARTPSMDSAEQGQTYLFIAAIMYNFGDVSLTVGRHFGPYDKIDFGATVCQTTAFGWSLQLEYSFFDATRDQIRIGYKGAYFGLFKNAKNEDGDYDVMLPMIAVGYEYGGFGAPLSFGVHALYQTFTDDYAAWVDTDGDGTVDAVASNGTYGEALTSYGVVGNVTVNMAPLSISAQANYGVNTGDMGVGGGSAVAVGDKFEDTTSMRGWVAVSYMMGAATLAAGLGYSSINNDETYEAADQAMSYYVSCKYAIQPNFSVTPIVHIQDKMKSGGVKGVSGSDADEGTVTTVGVLFNASI